MVVIRQDVLFLFGRGTAAAIGLAVTPIAARYFPSSAWSALVEALAIVGLASAVGAALRPMTVRALADPTRLKLVLAAKFVLSVVAGVTCGVAWGSLKQCSLLETTLVGTLGLLATIGPDCELIAVQRCTQTQFFGRVVAAAVLGAGVVLWGALSHPIAVMLMLGACLKQLIGVRAALAAVNDGEPWRLRMFCDLGQLVREERSHVGSAGFTALARAVTYYFQTALLLRGGYDELVAGMYIVGRYLEPAASIAVSGLTDLTVRHSSTRERGGSLGTTILDQTLAMRRLAVAGMGAVGLTLIVGSSLLLATPSLAACSLVIPLVLIAAMRVFVSPNAWIPYVLGRPQIIWKGEIVRSAAVGCWLVWLATTPPEHAVLWVLAVVESLGYIVFQFMLRRSMKSR